MSLIIKMDSINGENHLSKAVPYIMNEAKTKGLVYSNSDVTSEEILEMFKLYPLYPLAHKQPRV